MWKIVKRAYVISFRSMRIKEGISAVITGASTGIGKAIALEMARKYKARLAINARSQEDLDSTAKAIEAAGGQVTSVCGNIADKAVMNDLVNACRERFGEIDWLINNAGFARPGRMQDLSPQDWRDVFDVNVFAPVELTYAVLPEFLKRKSGKVVNIASVAGKVAFPGSICYASTKFALTGFSEGLAAELGPQGVDVITVCPGLVRTEFFRKNKNAQDLSAMAEEKSLQGWILKNIVSISSEEAAKEILRACEQGGCQEIILTGPGKVIERLAGICPPAVFWLSRKVPADRGPKKVKNLVD
jgi:short-subunit dehydrogenase